MDYEKAYKEALERAKEQSKISKPREDVACLIFPELKKTEDEQIKEDITFIIANTDLSAVSTSFVDMIKWLEKKTQATSLVRPYSNWKPSEKQLNALEGVVEQKNMGFGWEESPLGSLLIDLKNLTE